MNENKLTTLQHIKKCLDSIRLLIGQVLSATTDALEELENKITPDTWKKNTASSEGYVDKGEGQINKVWGTDAEGNPGWKEPNEIDTIIASNVLFNDGSNAEENLNGLKKSVSDGKELVAGAITEKGVETAADATFQEMADNIGEIETGGGEPKLQEKTATLSTSKQTVIADEEYEGLSSVVIPGVEGTANTSDVLSGKTFNSGTAGIGKSGSMANNGSTTRNTTLTNDNNYVYMNIPLSGYYNTGSKLMAPLSNISDIGKICVFSGFNDAYEITDNGYDTRRTFKYYDYNNKFVTYSNDGYIYFLKSGTYKYVVLVNDANSTAGGSILTVYVDRAAMDTIQCKNNNTVVTQRSMEIKTNLYISKDNKQGNIYVQLLIFTN